jgi:hypothetical protein
LVPLLLSSLLVFSFYEPLFTFFCVSVFYFLFLFFCLVFYRPSFFPLPFHPCFVSVFRLIWVSSLAYPNLLGTKRLGCCCCDSFVVHVWFSIRFSSYPVVLYFQDLSKTIEIGFQPDKTRLFQYFIKPCIIMFEKSDKVLCSILEMLKSFVTGDGHLFPSPSNLNYPRELSCRFCVVTTILIFLCNDQKLHRNLSLSKLVIKGILEYVRQQLVSYLK